MTDGIYMNHSEVHASGAQMEAEQQEIKNAIDQLQANLRTVIGTWEGPDQEYYYQTVVPTWESQIHALDQQLGILVQILAENSHTYARTANSNAQNFENIRFA